MQLITRLCIGTLSATSVLFPTFCQAQATGAGPSGTLPGNTPSFVTPGSPSSTTTAPQSPARAPGNPALSTKGNASSTTKSPLLPAAPVARPPSTTPKPKPESDEHFENYYSELPARPTAFDSQEILNLIENQINAIQHHDINRAYNLFTSNQFRQTTSFEDFKYFVDSFPVFSKNKNALFGNLDLHRNGIASIQGTLTSIDGQTLRVEYKFVKEGSQWKIVGIELFRPSYQPQTEMGPQPYDFQADIDH